MSVTGTRSRAAAIPMTSARECAWSSETSRVRCPASAAACAVAAASVVFPTPPFPTKNWTRAGPARPSLLSLPPVS
nr:hypothetical protein JVH1_1554 [Rhodococcus sp. JVH1]